MDIEKYLVGKPVYESGSEADNQQGPAMTYMSPAQVPEADCRLEFKWIYGPPEPAPQNLEHVHDNDEIIFHFGGGPHTSRDLGAEIEFYIGGQLITFNTTSLVFIPAGVPHGPINWRKFTRPHIQMAITLGPTPDGSPRNTSNRDSEEYIVRTPIREVGRGVKNRQMPTMTYLNRHLVLGANYYLECGWIYGMPEPNPHVFEHVHNYNELVFHFGSDPDRPEYLGGEIEYCIEGQPLTISTTSGLFMPKGIKHGPLTWKKYTRPHVEMTLIMGAGTFKEVWSAEAFGGHKESDTEV
ncbi:MAG: hypothetical protein V3S02_04095 [Dehalococcoidales bacterium]